MLLKIVRIFLAPIKKYIGKLFPRTTVIGRILRHIYAIIRPSRVRSSQLPESVLQPKENTAYSSELQMCDILVQVDNFLTGGLENVVLDLNKTCIQSGMKLVFLVLGEAGEGVERARAAGMSVVVTPYSPEKYQQILNIIKPDVVLTHYSTHGLEFCHRLNIPVIQVIHNAYVWLNGNSLDIFKEAIPYTTLYVAVSEWVKEFSTHRLGIPEDQCIVISNGVDTQKILSNNKVKARKELRAQFGFSDDDFVFLSVGSITHQKNHLAAIKAFHHALPKCPHARLIILGAAYEKPLLNEIQEYINVNNLKKYIIYAGTSKRPQDFYAMADAMLHAAFFEGGPLSLLEGVTANLPIVTSDVGLVRHLKKMDKIFVIPAPIDIVKRLKIW